MDDDFTLQFDQQEPFVGRKGDEGRKEEKVFCMKKEYTGQGS
jgi:hypothetical protein